MSLNLNNHAIYNVGNKCSICNHKEICKYIEKYQQIKEKVNNMIEEDNINFVNISCNYFLYNFNSNALIKEDIIRNNNLSISQAPEDREVNYNLKG